MATAQDSRQTTENMLPQDAPSVASGQLDFYQAMADFKVMFPSMGEEVIEAVLRANNGGVDATIDQLLTMSVDNEEDVYANAEVPEAVVISGAPPSYDEALQTSTPSHIDSLLTPIPSYNVAKSMTNFPLQTTAVEYDKPPLLPHNEAGGYDKLPFNDYTPKLSHQQADPLPEKYHPDRVPDLLSMDFVPTDSITSSSQKVVHKTSTYKNWNPPLLGTLPDDFLRLSVQQPFSVLHSHNHSVNGTSSGSRQKRRSRSGRHSRHHRRDPSSELNSSVIHQKLVENERRRSIVTADTSEAQLLNDERMALLIQNEEFLTMLRLNDDFMKTLERDRLNATAFEPPLMDSHLQQHSHYKTERLNLTGLEPVVSENQNQNLRPEPPPLATMPAGPPPLPPDQIEGYGDDHSTHIGAFPFSQDMPKDDNAELRKQLQKMEGSTRKKFHALAKKFFSKKKKTPKQFLKESAPSTMNLLEDMEDEDQQESLEDVPKWEPLNPPVPNYKTVQRPPYHPDTITTYHDEHKVTDMV